MSTKKFSDLFAEVDFLEGFFKSFGYIVLSAGILKIAASEFRHNRTLVCCLLVIVFVIFVTLAYAFASIKTIFPLLQQIELQFSTNVPSSPFAALKTKAGAIAVGIVALFVAVGWFLITAIASQP